MPPSPRRLLRDIVNILTMSPSRGLLRLPCRYGHRRQNSGVAARVATAPIFSWAGFVR